jgi:hypothetical protein
MDNAPPVIKQTTQSERRPTMSFMGTGIVAG